MPKLDRMMPDHPTARVLFGQVLAVEMNVPAIPEGIPQRSFDRGPAAFRNMQPNEIGPDDHVFPLSLSVRTCRVTTLPPRHPARTDRHMPCFTAGDSPKAHL
ncbi:MAG: hypothetical protein ACK5IP_10575, partial [Paracoccus sp. (in: a-proteobacteria)]